MSYWLGRLVLWMTGWRVRGGIDLARYPKGVMIAAPHTSKWDFIYAMACLYVMRIPVRYLAKRELFRPPLGWLLKLMGGVPVDRSRSTGMVEAMADTLAHADRLIVLIPPEGTRGATAQWRTGFYHVARLSGTPIFPAYLDYRLKEGGVMEPFWPTGELESDLPRLKEQFKGIIPRNPENFVL